ncbi:BMC domain-containing protein [Virgibacillus alimentarius]|uniref:Microcompartment protein CcmL/EutN n=1 Tax=Virgibacillus alimentarius TaxID=698769 RepID=A0ABS4S6B0_9BACI|nr:MULTISPECIES: BMC domain-containing protein [Virgibacillus]MBP2257020.1 microcompartment protein CcmL/EutN [Virgibacillus alimentarius]HLR69680.1 BMC domain-containing protein [Virgibacillus sp.]
MIALGLIETVGYSTAVSAADAAVKAADVEIIGMEKVIGVSGYVGVTVHFSGDVAAVTSAVEAGNKAGEAVGEIISSHVIPRAHSNVNDHLLSKFSLLEESKSLLHEKEDSTDQPTEKASKIKAEKENVDEAPAKEVKAHTTAKKTSSAKKTQNQKNSNDEKKA